MQRKEREMGLINKYDFLKKLKSSKYYCADDEYKSGYNDCIFHAEVTVEHIPTVYAVPVIRCKDCKHHHGTDCEVWDYRKTEDDKWCAWAERKEE